MTSVTATRVSSLLGHWRGSGPSYSDLASAIRMLVIDSRIPDGARLPSERSLAEVLGVSRTTTARAYEELRERGILVSRRGSGSVVTLPLAEVSSSALLESPDVGDGIALTHASGQAVPGLGAAFERALTGLPALLATTGYLPDGYEPLRERIAARHTAEGLPTDPSQIIVTSGAQGALAIVASTMVSRSDRVMVEACGFPHAFDAVLAEGGRLLALPHGPTPWNVADIRDAAGAADLAYLVPDFHNPTGALMPESQRADIARALRRVGAQTIVDETLRHMGLEGQPLPPPYATFDPEAVTIGSLSKSIWGGLRLGWIRAPHHLVSAFVQTRVRFDLGSSAFEQVVATEALTAGIDGSHLPRLRAQRDILIDAIRESLPMFDAPVPGGGLSVWLQLPSRSSSRLVAAAREEGLRLLPGSRFFASPSGAGEQYLRIPFAHTPDVLVEAVRRLARAWQGVEHGAPVQTVSEHREIDLIA